MDAKELAKAVDKVQLPEFVPLERVNIAMDNQDTGPQELDDSDVIDKMIDKLDKEINNLPAGFRMNPIQFEKARHSLSVKCPFDTFVLHSFWSFQLMSITML